MKSYNSDRGETALTTSVPNPVQSFYESFPYPAVMDLGWVPTALEEINFLAGRWITDPLPRHGEVLVAGCGTVEAVIWALSLPQCNLTGIDISESSLATARKLARATGARNVQFARADLNNLTGFDGPYDLIISGGVLHHLPNPAAGLNALATRLARGGVGRFLLYGQHNRMERIRVAKLIDMLTPADSSLENKFQIASKVVQGFVGQTGSIARAFETAKALLESDETEFADSYCHPQERTYNTTQLFELLEECGLRFVEWTQPGLWQPWWMFDDPEIQRQCQQMPSVDRYKFAESLGISQLEFYAELDGSDPRQPVDSLPDRQLWQTVCRQRQEFTAEIHGDQVGEAQPVRCRCELIPPDNILIRAPYGTTFLSHQLAAYLIEACDGSRNLLEAARHACDQFTPKLDLDSIADFVAATFRQLIYPHLVLIPVATG